MHPGDETPVLRYLVPLLRIHNSIHTQDLLCLLWSFYLLDSFPRLVLEVVAACMKDGSFKRTSEIERCSPESGADLRDLKELQLVMVSALPQVSMVKQHYP